MSDVHRKDVELYRGLEPLLGADVATMLLERLPSPHEELATKADLRSFAKEVDSRFARVDARFDQVDARFDQVDARFAQVDARFGQIDGRFEQVALSTQVDDRFTQAAKELDLKLAAQSAELKGFVHEVVGGAIQMQTRTILFGMAGIMVGATTLAAALGQVI